MILNEDSSSVAIWNSELQQKETKTDAATNKALAYIHMTMRFLYTRPWRFQ